jgi:hypothetical protein
MATHGHGMTPGLLRKNANLILKVWWLPSLYLKFLIHSPLSIHPKQSLIRTNTILYICIVYIIRSVRLSHSAQPCIGTAQTLPPGAVTPLSGLTPGS